MALALAACCAAPGEAQILPPIYKPLPVEEGARYSARADSLRARAAELTARAEVLESGARTLRQNGAGVAEKLVAQAVQLRAEAGRLEAQATADLQTSRALRLQGDDLARRVEEGLQRLEAARAEIARISEIVEADSAAAAERMAELRAEARADSQAAVTYRAHSAAIRAQADSLEAGSRSARERLAELRAQADQLEGYAGEIRSMRGSADPTADRLEQEGASLRASAEKSIRASREDEALAESHRVQAGRLLLPVRDREDGMRFYGEDGRSVLRNLVFSIGDGGGAGSLNTELVSDYAGPVRLGVGLVLAELRGKGVQDDSAAPAGAALERFYAGGGNAVLYASLPLLFDRSSYHSFTVQTLAKLGADVPGTGNRAAAGSVPANLDVGVEAYGTFNTFGGKIRAFALLRGAYARGNEPFRANLGKTFGGLHYSQLTFGAEIASLAKVLLSGATAPDGLGRDLSLTFQLAPNPK